MTIRRASRPRDQLRKASSVGRLHRYERALNVAAAVRSERDRVIATIVDEIVKRKPDGGYFSAKMMEALLEHRVGEPTVLGPIANEAAQRATAESKWEQAREYFLLVAQWSRRERKPDEDVRARRDAAECYVKQADAADSKALESAFLERAIQSLRTVPGEQARVEMLHQRLVSAEKESLKELKEYSGSVELGNAPKQARATVAGVSFDDALVRLACIWQPQPLDQLKATVVETASKTVLYSAIPKVMVNREGKTIAKRGSLITGTTEEQAEALRQAMFEQAGQQREYIALAAIRPARAQIADEHYVSLRSLLPLTAASAFVPPGREEVFAAGLAAGFNGDDAVALHVLTPQFEQAIRTILAQQGTLTSKLDDDGIQKERDLGWLLYCDDAKRVFGDALLFDMQGLLVERFGGNLRNVMAHGLAEVAQMVGLQSTYFWWLTLHMVVRPLLTQILRTDEGKTDEGKTAET